MPLWHSKHYYDMHSQYNYYINIDDKTLIKQKCFRLLNEVQTNKYWIDDLINNNDKFIKRLTLSVKQQCKDTIKLNDTLKHDYEKQKYKIMTREDIYKNIVNILRKSK